MSSIPGPPEPPGIAVKGPPVPPAVRGPPVPPAVRGPSGARGILNPRGSGVAALARANVQKQDDLVPANELTNMWMWGNGSYYRLSQGDLENRGYPVQVKVREKDLCFVEFACGAAHILGRTLDGRVYSWGKCHVGQLGHGSEDDDVMHPTLIEALKDIKIVKIACGTSHILLIDANGDVYTNGVGYFGTIGHGDEKMVCVPKLVETLKGQKVIKVAGGSFHSVFLLEDGSVYTCGKNDYGQLGYDAKLSKSPQKIPDLPPIGNIFCGSNNVFAIDRDGEIFVWGENSAAQLGIGNQVNQNIPLKLKSSYFGSKIVQISSGPVQTYALAENGLVYCWGQAIYLGLGVDLSEKEVFIKHPQKHCFFEKYPAKIISVGEQHVIAVTQDGNLWTWGEATYGKLGDGSVIIPTDAYHPVVPGFTTYPKQVGLTIQQHIVDIAAGSNHTMVLLQ